MTPASTGGFWVGVRTTGIYCRPVCPSRTPLSRNVDFFAHPAAAEDAGLRPCRRCRPEAAPGLAAAGRAERASSTGRCASSTRARSTSGDVASLAARLHVGDRHLRRPLRRAPRAPRPMPWPAAGGPTSPAGSSPTPTCASPTSPSPPASAASASATTCCGRPSAPPRPSCRADLRTPRFGPAARRAPTAGAALSLRLAVRPPFDGDALLDWFAARAVDGLEVVRRRRRTGAGSPSATAPAR